MAPIAAIPDHAASARFRSRLSEHVGEDRQRRRGHQRGRDAVQRTDDQQQRAARGEGGQHRHDEEERGAEHEHPAAPQQVGRAPAQQGGTAQQPQV
ncbi:hypothetical protein GCM10017567_80680 [Amycolatopsis bullii]|uniref:Uncharacterized protein n=1 Tax=Amycolatopsis bullii TaxID=941987 RepID=A0ABQ3KRQ5_9PSEU|nr:hypothetical protein GCM10017567_80680 [Amycolatopsis bullii]